MTRRLTLVFALAGLAACATDPTAPPAPDGVGRPQLGPPPGGTNAPPVVTITSPADGATFSIDTPLGATVAVAADLADPDAADTHTCAVDWGISVTTGLVTEANGSGTCTATLTLAQPGPYTVTVSVIDPMGNTATQSVAIDVAAAAPPPPPPPPPPAPAPTSLLAEGRINVERGSYPGSHRRRGQVSFGVMARTSPETGELRGGGNIRLLAAGRVLRVTSFESLAVEGCRAELRGRGRMHGRTRYDFLIVALDGNRPGCGGVDRVRIRIWRERHVIFDSERRSAATTDPRLRLTHGLIRILP